MNWRTAGTALLWIFAAYATWSFLGNYWAPDACVDAQHGSFDYQAWTCSLNENKPYVETAIFLVPGFLPALLSLFGAVAGTLMPLARATTHCEDPDRIKVEVIAPSEA